LLWLRWKLTIRGYTRNWQAAVGLAFMLLWFVPISIAAGVLTAIAYTQLARDLATQVLFVVLTGLYIAWAVLPLLQYSLNEGLDVTKLQAYPLTRGEQMVSLMLSTLLDVSTIILLGCYIGAFIGWQSTPLAGALTAIALVLTYAHTITLSQLALAALMGMLRSRRYRDLVIVFFAVIGAVCSLSGQLLGRAVRFTSFDSLPSLHVDGYLQWLPPGMAARAITLANAGQYQAALPWLAALVVLLPLLMLVWARVLDRGITTAETSTSGPRVRRRRRAAPAAPTAGQPATGAPAGASALPFAGSQTEAQSRRGLLPGAMVAIAWKDLRYYWRDPQLKAMLLSSLAFLVIIFLPNLAGGGNAGRVVTSAFQPTQVLLAPIPALYIALNLSLNALGIDRGALQTLFLFPVRPLDILWGKNLAAGILSYASQVVLVLILAVISGGWQYVPAALVLGLAGVLVLTACGNVSSVLLPFRMRQMRVGSGNYSTEGGFLRGLLSIVVFLITLVMLLPIAVAIAVPYIFDHPAWLVASLPACLVYGVALHQTASRLIAPVLLSRAPEILRVTVPET
jgi:hypothetical protein